MAKQGMHNNDHNDGNISRGHNNPRKSVTITTGTYKRRKTYRERAWAHENPDPVAQHEKNVWLHDTHHPPSHKDQIGDSSRTGSDSDEDTGTRGW